jgi:hypothetical protein
MVMISLCEKGLQVERTRTTEAEELVHGTIPVLVTGSRSWRKQEPTNYPDSPQGVVANEVYPYPPHPVSTIERGARDAMQDAVSNRSRGFTKRLREAKHSPRYF